MPHILDLPHSGAMRDVIVALFKQYDVPLVQGSYIKFDKTDTWQAFYAEVIQPDQIAIAHTYLQNGDVMHDPEIVYWMYAPMTVEQAEAAINDQVTASETVRKRYINAYSAKRFVPYRHRLDSMGLDSAFLDGWKDGKPTKGNTYMLRDLVSFSKTWSENLKYQLKHRTPSRIINPDKEAAE